ncbi:MAG: glycerophosphodiester phosphodiesterase family protein [Aeromicrobium sp.]|uniref:glycerophosphodiester phosphodiesterase family protein n=1 Tax=Aeromicrobium sp. TaxID=1871063 RepID=UPI00262182B2|nr:glycerophosphodiester phosphodiesterase family protein [Aeromicrobium sp.]MDF1705101.1 glycerophosphodiester phosphodiesterase family protein [Aeromicrobium sp.]
MTIAIAHRGGSLTATNVGIENSLEAFAHAASLGYRHLETDVVCSRDGVAYVSHDVKLHRLTGQRLHIGDLDAARVDELRLDGRARIPRLDALLRAHPEAWFSIDVKAADAVEETCRVVEAENAVDRVCLGSFDHRRTLAIRERLPQADTAASRREVVEALVVPPSRRRPSYRWLSVPARRKGLPVVTRRFVEAAHATGVGVLVWTIDEPREIERLVDLGVDGIFTDRTDTLRDVLVALGTWEN